MGKLHTLKRAILREPEKWRRAQYAVRRRDGQWHPGSYYGCHSYRSFIRKVLQKHTAT